MAAAEAAPAPAVFAGGSRMPEEVGRGNLPLWDRSSDSWIAESADRWDQQQQQQHHHHHQQEQQQQQQQQQPRRAPREALPLQSIQRNIPPVPRRVGSVDTGAAKEHQGGKASAHPPYPSACMARPVPPPPPVLSAAQQEHLRELQQHQQHQKRNQRQQQQSNGVGCAGLQHSSGGVQQHVANEVALSLPSRHRAQRQPDETHPRQGRQRTLSSGQHLSQHPSFPQHANAALSGTPLDPHVATNTPVSGTHSNSIRQQHQQQLAFSGRVVPAPERYTQPQQHQGHRWTHGLSAPEPEGDVAGVSSGGHHRGASGACSTGGFSSQSGSGQQAPSTEATAFRRGSMPRPVQAEPLPTVPPEGLRLQTCGPADTPAPAPVTPVMVYAYPYGYMMAYPNTNIPNAQAHEQPLPSQASTSWNPYESVSPPGDGARARFGRRGTKEEARGLSPESSRAAVSATMGSSSEGLCKTRGDERMSQGQNSRASSWLVKSMPPGTVETRSYDGKKSSHTANAVSLELCGGADDVEFKTPSRAPRRSLTSGGGAVAAVAAGGSNKENSRKAPGVVGEKGNLDLQGVDDQRQLSGHKRGGSNIDVEKQKAFSGSYFQVSPGSFLQSSKRQRYFA